jgi:hypothetical protein
LGVSGGLGVFHGFERITGQSSARAVCGSIDFGAQAFGFLLFQQGDFRGINHPFFTVPIMGWSGLGRTQFIFKQVKFLNDVHRINSQDTCTLTAAAKLIAIPLA